LFLYNAKSEPVILAPTLSAWLRFLFLSQAITQFEGFERMASSRAVRPRSRIGVSKRPATGDGARGAKIVSQKAAVRDARSTTASLPTEGETTAPSLSDGKTKAARPAGRAKSAVRSGAKPKALVQRIYNTIDVELTKLEKQKGTSSQDRERASRALSQMVGSLEKAIDMQREMTKRTSKGGGQKDMEALAHAEDLRREIAERLERLNRKRAAGRRAQ
jgi:hypothetical protein